MASKGVGGPDAEDGEDGRLGAHITAKECRDVGRHGGKNFAALVLAEIGAAGQRRPHSG